jgi:hypothetical protein
VRYSTKQIAFENAVCDWKGKRAAIKLAREKVGALKNPQQPPKK